MADDESLPINKMKMLSWSKIQLLTSIVLAIASFVLFGYWALRLADQSEQVRVVVAAHDLTAPTVLTAEDVMMVSVRRDAVPKTAVADLAKTVGLTLTHTVSQHQVLTINEFAGKLNPDLAGFSVPSDLKGFLLSSAWFASPLPKVKKDDTVTILVSVGGREGGRNTGILAQHIRVLSADAASDGTVSRMLVAIDLPTSMQILQARANNFLLQVLIDGLAPPEFMVTTSTESITKNQ